MIAGKHASHGGGAVDAPQELLISETKNSNAKDAHGNGQCRPTLETNLDNSFMSKPLSKLFRAYRFAMDCDRSKWDFAVELSVLKEDGVALDELRWLVGKGFIEHARELETSNGVGRAFDSSGGFKISDQSCFVITSAGLRMIEENELVLAESHGKLSFDPPPIIGTVNESTVQTDQLPIWDDQRHELRVGKVVVKRFKWRASNQEAILTAFQEEGWPARIDDPLPPAPETDPKRRLSDAIKCLNRKQQNPILRFTGDGTGEGVLWEFVNGVAKLTF